MELRGLVLVDALTHERDVGNFTRAREALQLIEDVDPIRLNRILTDLRMIVFLEFGPEYSPSLKACILPDVRDLTVPQVAVWIVHGATHARLWNAGIRYGAAIRSRVEHVCVSSELAFLRRVPESEVLQDYVRHTLERPWWGEDTQFERRQQALISAGMPRWARSLLRGFPRLRREQFEKNRR